ncbi:MAG: GIN domain-containing protein [Moraxellaceae bacterium]
MNDDALNKLFSLAKNEPLTTHVNDVDRWISDAVKIGFWAGILYHIKLLVIKKNILMSIVTTALTVGTIVAVALFSSKETLKKKQVTSSFKNERKQSLLQDETNDELILNKRFNSLNTEHFLSFDKLPYKSIPLQNNQQLVPVSNASSSIDSIIIKGNFNIVLVQGPTFKITSLVPDDENEKAYAYKQNAVYFDNTTDSTGSLISDYQITVPDIKYINLSGICDFSLEGPVTLDALTFIQKEVCSAHLDSLTTKFLLIESNEACDLNLHATTTTGILKINDAASINFEIKAQKLDLSMDGASDNKGKIECDSLFLAINGAIDIESELTVNYLKLKLDGVSELDLSGKVTSLDLVQDGITKLKAKKLDLTNARVQIDGISKATINPASSLTGKVNGLSKLKYGTKPKNLLIQTEDGAKSRRRIL